MDIFASFWKYFVEPSDKKRMSQLPLPRGIKEHIDIPYIDDGNRYHKLDVYYPESTTGKLPVIIDIHGGGWMYGDKELNKPYCLYLADRGYVVFSMSYRLVPEVTAIDQIREVSLALKKIEEIMLDYPCDTNRIFITGDSAGGHLCAYAAALNGCKKAAQAFGFEQNGMVFRAAALTSPVAYIQPVGIMGVYFKQVLPKNYDVQQYTKYLDFDKLLEETVMPPTFVVTSSGDTVGHDQSVRIAEAISKTGTKTKLCDWGKYEGKALPHVFSVVSPETIAGAQSITDMLDFFDECCNTVTV